MHACMHTHMCTYAHERILIDVRNTFKAWLFYSFLIRLYAEHSNRHGGKIIMILKLSLPQICIS